MIRIALTLFLLVSKLLCFSQMDFFCSRPDEKNKIMTRAWYPYQIIDSIIVSGNSGFIIADKKNKPNNFISSEEMCYNSLANEKPDSKETYNYLNEYSSYEEYLVKQKETQIFWDSLAKIEHKVSNQLDMMVYIQNTSKDTIWLPLQDGSLIGILEFQAKDNTWMPTEYWWQSWCGNSYYNQSLLPNKTIQFGLNTNLGNQQTNMRIKIQGIDTIYYSNEFKGSIHEMLYNSPNEIKAMMLKEKRGITFLDSVRKGEYSVMNFDVQEIIIEEE